MNSDSDSEVMPRSWKSCLYGDQDIMGLMRDCMELFDMNEIPRPVLHADHDYPRSGLIPQHMVGQRLHPYGDPFDEGDTYFSEFAAHNPAEAILSESEESYIIANHASYDSRQYPDWLDGEDHPGRNTPEGQGFGHCLVIPKRRIYNVLDHEATAEGGTVIRELRKHFQRFWTTQSGRSKIISRTRDSFDAQNAVLESKSPAVYTQMVPQLNADFARLAHDFADLEPDAFEYAFHAYPDCSVGHLHMHVFPKSAEMRQFSSTRHEWKTIPMDMVLEVEEEIEAEVTAEAKAKSWSYGSPS